ncbi:MAG: hypothetical protein AAB250_11330, partial [Bdellovibrionota bacterium]
GEKWAEMYSLLSPDQRLALSSIFGSNARSIVLSSELRDTFERVNAVQRDYVTYNFVASAIDRLDPYGIRYIVTRNQTVSSPLWKPIADLKWRNNAYQVQERINPVKPVYCLDGANGVYIDSEYAGNEIKIILDRDCPSVVATFYRWPGWRVLVNGETQDLADPKVVFLTAANLKRGDDLRFQFAPWWTRHWWAFILASLVAIAAAIAPTLSSRRRGIA